VLGGIRALASIGPRDAASPASDRAAAYVAGRLRAAGYRVTLQTFAVPAGVSWGVRVPAGTSVDVVADPPGFDPTKPHVVVGAHLDTVPQSPGAEDDASGLMIMAEVARMTRQQPGAIPVRFVAFGAEEARGGNGTLYAFGSRHFVAGLGAPERRAVRGMVALDRVGVAAAAVPVCHVAGAASSLADAVRRAAAPVVPTKGCTNKASDHVSFARVGIPAARLGSVPYAAYHSAGDVPSVVDRGQLTRSGGVLWAWIRSLR
jgi:Zn-dependent M28 family amino/carboxypeptidase